MADAVSTQIIQDTDRVVIVKFTNLSDGTGETNVKKVDVSELEKELRRGIPCTSVDIERIIYTTAGMSVDILWDGNPNQVAWTVSGDGHFHFEDIGPIKNDATVSVSGDILFSTQNASNTDRYTILLKLSKNYAQPVLT